MPIKNRKRLNVTPGNKPSRSPDPTSKFFIRSQALLGSNRLSITENLGRRANITSFVYTVIINVLVVVFNIWCNLSAMINFGAGIWVYLSISVLGYALCGRLRDFYDNLKLFDDLAGCKPKNEDKLKTFLVTYIISTCICYFAFFSYFNKFVVIDLTPLVMLLRASFVFELHFYTFMLNLLRSRLRLLMDGIALSLESNENVLTAESVKEAKLSSCDGNSGLYLELYHQIIELYKKLFEAIKWQFTTIIVMTFIGTMWILYTITKASIQGLFDNGLAVVSSYVLLCFADSVPLFTPCLTSSGLTTDVCKLRTLLALRLDSDISKEDRCLTRALLCLTKVNNLSMSLMGIFPIDNTLPLKFISLIVSSLIIMLQFVKVTDAIP